MSAPSTVPLFPVPLATACTGSVDLSGYDSDASLQDEVVHRTVVKQELLDDTEIENESGLTAAGPAAVEGSSGLGESGQGLNWDYSQTAAVEIPSSQARNSAFFLRLAANRDPARIEVTHPQPYVSNGRGGL